VHLTVVPDVFVFHVVLERSSVMPIIGELVAGRMPQHVRWIGNGSFAASPVRAIVFRNPVVVAGPLRSVIKTYRDSGFSRRS
jgi:hypothetical protein